MSSPISTDVRPIATPHSDLDHLPLADRDFQIRDTSSYQLLLKIHCLSKDIYLDHFDNIGLSDSNFPKYQFHKYIFSRDCPYVPCLLPSQPESYNVPWPKCLLYHYSWVNQWDVESPTRSKPDPTLHWEFVRLVHQIETIYTEPDISNFHCRRETHSERSPSICFCHFLSKGQENYNHDIMYSRLYH